MRAREESVAFGISTDLVHLPGGCARSIKLAIDANGERDADIDEMCRCALTAALAAP